MTDPKVLDGVFHYLMTRMVATGRAPHYTELARALGCSAEEGRQALHDLMNTGLPGWLHPGTDYIGTLPPLSNVPTQYRITVEGRQRWTAQ